MTTNALDPKKIDEVTDKAIGNLAGAGADKANPAFAAGGFALMFPLLQRWEQLFESFPNRPGRSL